MVSFLVKTKQTKNPENSAQFQHGKRVWKMCYNEPERASNLIDFLSPVRTCFWKCSQPIRASKKGEQRRCSKYEKMPAHPRLYFLWHTMLFLVHQALVVLHSRTLLAAEPLSQLLALPIPWHTALLPSSILPNSSMLQSRPPKKVGNRVLRN